MPAPVVKGILVSISIITALSVAVLENPQIQAWLEQQRQKIVELLRSIGEELDPQTRRTAEAFAFEGRTPANDEGLQREVSGSKEATAVATGRCLSSPSTIRRIPVQGPIDPDEAEERRRKGREYLAKRNLQMYELQQRKKAATAEEATTPPSPTSFDEVVDKDGKLRLPETESELPSPPAIAPLPKTLPEEVKAEMAEVERQLAQPTAVGEPSSSTAAAAGWSFGSLLANPFSDEYGLDRSETPKPAPPVPPKRPLDTPEDPPISTIPGSFEPAPQRAGEELTYEEQLAIALSLSEQEANKSQQPEDDDAQLRAAIAASLRETGEKHAEPLHAAPETQPLVDLSPPSPTVQPQAPTPRGRWETFFDQDYSPSREPLSLAPAAPAAEEVDELYRVTPELTHARLATLNSQQASSPQSSTIAYDPVRDAADQSLQQQGAIEASFYSAASTAPSPASTRTLEHETTTQLVDISEDQPAEGARTPTARSSVGFHTESENDSDTFASFSRPASRSHSRARSAISNVEVVDVGEDSDFDMLPEAGAGIVTPDSWSEVGSRDGDSEMDDDHHPEYPRTA